MRLDSGQPCTSSSGTPPSPSRTYACRKPRTVEKRVAKRSGSTSASIGTVWEHCRAPAGWARRRRGATVAITETSPTTVFRTCPLCEAGCGLQIELDGPKVKRIRGDQDDVFSHGFVCPKGST